VFFLPNFVVFDIVGKIKFSKNIKYENLTPKGLREPKRPFLILGRLPYVPKVVGVFETS
jgi:hypothetical protein